MQIEKCILTLLREKKELKGLLDRQIDRQTDRQIDRQIDRQVDRKMHFSTSKGGKKS